MTQAATITSTRRRRKASSKAYAGQTHAHRETMLRLLWANHHQDGRMVG